MGATERVNYIGCPNGVVLCIDKRDGFYTSGRLYHQYQTEPIEFRDLEQAMRFMERLYDRLNFPMRGNKQRSFSGSPVQLEKRIEKERMIKVMSDDEMMRKHGDLGTFIIRVQYRQHNSWQGQITWVEKNEKQTFRSALELIRMIDGVVGTEDDDAATQNGKDK